jgi:glyoxylase-like metal-dependent hydrolase (beta-lactamase superfamily II)
MNASKLTILHIPVSAYEQNCRVLIAGGKAIVVDPGAEAKKILGAIAGAGAVMHEIWLTHSHLDHCGAVAELLEHAAVPLLAHPGEKMFRERIRDISIAYGLGYEDMRNCPEPTQELLGGERLDFEGYGFEVRFTPGHSPGHLVFYCAQEGVLLAGDTLFSGSIGRTDLPGGNANQLLDSIRREIYTLPDETHVLSGHGPDTTVGEEKMNNPFVRGC